MQSRALDAPHRIRATAPHSASHGRENNRMADERSGHIVASAGPGNGQTPVLGAAIMPTFPRGTYKFGQLRVRFFSCSGVSARGPSATCGAKPFTEAGSIQQSTTPRLRVQYGGVSGGGSVGRQ